MYKPGLEVTLGMAPILIVMVPCAFAVVPFAKF